jgi:hypothetical protein
MVLNLSGTLAANVTVTTTKQGIASVNNATAGNYTVTYTTGTGASVVLPQGYTSIVASDAVNGCVILTGTGAAQLSQNVTASGSTLTIDMSKGWNVNVTLSANVTSVVVTNWPTPAVKGKLLMDVTSTGAFGITGWPGTTVWAGGSPPTVTSGNGKKDTYGLTGTDGTNFRGYVISQDAS